MSEPERLYVIKPLTDEWNKHVRPGTAVYRYNGHTYGCIRPGGIAVSLEPNQTPFFEVPARSVFPRQLPDRIILPGSVPSAQEAVDALVKWCGTNWEPDFVCAVCSGTSPDCSEPIDVDGCDHGWDCPWLAVLAVANCG